MKWSKRESGGQQLHQYKQNEQSPVTWTHWTQKMTTTYDIISTERMVCWYSIVQLLRASKRT